MPTLTLLQAEGLVVRTFARCRTNIDNARSVARARARCSAPVISEVSPNTP